MVLAYNIVALDRTKKLPPLRKLLGSREPREPMTPDQLEAMARRWDRAINGA